MRILMYEDHDDVGLFKNAQGKMMAGVPGEVIDIAERMMHMNHRFESESFRQHGVSSLYVNPAILRDAVRKYKEKGCRA